MEVITNLFVQTSATLVGIIAGTLIALTIDRRNEKRRKVQRAQIILHSLSKEIGENYKTLLDVRPAFRKTPWGRSFYINTVAWETALASGDLPNIIGFQLTDTLSNHYAILVRVRYYLNLMTSLWLAPENISRYEEKRKGFHKAIINGLNQAINDYSAINNQINRLLS